MNTGTEPEVKALVSELLERLAPGRFRCTERKQSCGFSAINKPVDLHIETTEVPPRVAISIEVANVNTTQLVSEACRLYYDCCPRKILVLGSRNVPVGGKQQCEQLLARMYGQDSIEHTPARVVSYIDHTALEQAIRDLLLL